MCFHFKFPADLLRFILLLLKKLFNDNCLKKWVFIFFHWCNEKKKKTSKFLWEGGGTFSSFSLKLQSTTKNFCWREIWTIKTKRKKQRNAKIVTETKKKKNGKRKKKGHGAVAAPRYFVCGLYCCVWVCEGERGVVVVVVFLSERKRLSRSSCSFLSRSLFHLG